MRIAGKAGLFLEEIIEGTAGIGRLDRRGAARSATGIPRFPLDGCTSHEKLAIVTQIFFRDAHGDFLRALEPGSRIEMAAVLAGAKVGFALGTLAVEIDLHGRRHNGPA